MKARYETTAKLWLIAFILAAVGWIFFNPVSMWGCSSPANFEIIDSPKSGLIVVTDAYDDELHALTGKSSYDELDSVIFVAISKRPVHEFSFISLWVQSTGDSQMRSTTYWGYEIEPTRAEIKQIILDAANAEPPPNAPRTSSKGSATGAPSPRCNRQRVSATMCSPSTS